MSFSLNIDSVNRICEYSPQVMVYGWSSCRYEEVIDALSRPLDGFKKVYTHTLGIDTTSHSTLEGRKFSKITYPFDPEEEEEVGMARICKTAILNLILENFKRGKEGLQLIPLLFCIHISGKKRIDTPETIFDRTEEKIITNSELRRCYKLCSKDTIFNSISEVARETIKVVKLVYKGSRYEMVEIPMNWDDNHWKKAWYERQCTKINEPDYSESGWRFQLNQAVINEINAIKVPKRKASHDIAIEPPLKKARVQVINS